jgi:enoyl-[acyl-carrier protein] reductase I
LAYELGDSKIRVNAMSPGPIQTRAASGISNFSDLLEAGLAAPLSQAITIDNVGSVAAFMVSPASEAITGQVIYIDGGFSIESHHA